MDGPGATSARSGASGNGWPISETHGSGADAAIRQLFTEHWVGLCRLARLILGDGSAAEEAVQEAFIRTYSGWPRLRDRDRADLYLRAAVVNQCRSRLRRRAVEQRVNAAFHRRSPTTVEPPTIEPDEAARVAAAVRGLPTRQRAAVVLRYFEDLPEAEIAVTLGCSVGTVKSQLAKARGSLGRVLAARDEPRGPSPSAGPRRSPT